MDQARSEGRVYRTYAELWEDLKRWAEREKELVAANEAQTLVVNALLHRMSRAEAGDPKAFKTI